VTDPTAKTTTRFTDVLGRPISATNPLGQRTRLTWDALNRLTQTTDARGGTTQLAYDANGNLLSLTDAASHATSYADPQRAQRHGQDPLGGRHRLSRHPERLRGPLHLGDRVD
jgi:YD repeat-containing protein